MAVVEAPRTCGDCRLCCKVMAIGELQKPRNIWCHFCNLKAGPGCSIYDARPEECREYECAWLLGAFPESFKPNKVHFAAAATLNGKDLVLYIDPGYPDAYKAPKVKEELMRIRKTCNVLVMTTEVDVMYLDTSGAWIPAKVEPDPQNPYKVTVQVHKNPEELRAIRMAVR